MRFNVTRKELLVYWVEMLSDLQDMLRGQEVSYGDLVETIGAVANDSKLPYAWKHDTDYLHLNGYLEMCVGGHLVQVTMSAPHVSTRDHWCAILDTKSVP